VVSEALVNVQKHADARHARVHLRLHDGSLIAEVADDGRGGAHLGAGSGLSGLRDRVAALDGTLVVSSPEGGPTIVRAEIPCAS
jgi:signal transduction histidine kinase